MAKVAKKKEPTVLEIPEDIIYIVNQSVRRVGREVSPLSICLCDLRGLAVKNLFSGISETLADDAVVQYNSNQKLVVDVFSVANSE